MRNYYDQYASFLFRFEGSPRSFLKGLGHAILGSFV